MGRWRGGIGCSIYRNGSLPINSDATFVIFVGFRRVFDHTYKALIIEKRSVEVLEVPLKKGMSRFVLTKHSVKLRAFLGLT